MIQQYFYEIVTLIIIVFLFSIFMTLRKAQKNKKLVDDAVGVDTATKPKDEIQEIQLETVQQPIILHTSAPVSQSPEIKESPKSKRKKCEVPEHGKIVKENFREFKGVKLLVAEDNAINQRVISGLLSTSGVEITMADDGQIALDILEQNNDFDIILMDAHMPNIDGFEATKRIRENPNYDHIAVVALSGDTAPDDIQKMTDAGMEAHLEKPLRMDDFYDVLYAYTKADSSDADIIEIVMTKELQGEKGLAVCGGDDNFYKDILREFIQNYSDSYEKIHHYLQNGDNVAADALLLDLIGISANIGAENINRIAHELKESIKDTHERSYFTTLDEYNAHLSILLKDIQNYLNA